MRKNSGNNEKIFLNVKYLKIKAFFIDKERFFHLK